MKKRILTLAVLASISSMAAVAAESGEIDMSDPTDVYTTLGLGYGNKGLDFSSMLLLSSTETQKSGIIFDAKDILDEQDHTRNPILNKDTHGTSYRLRWGTINTQNGLGLTLDAVNLDHPAFGRMTVAQFGTLATLPIGDDFIMFPIVFVGGVLVEDNTLDLLNYTVRKAEAGAAEAREGAALATAGAAQATAAANALPDGAQKDALLAQAAELTAKATYANGLAVKADEMKAAAQGQIPLATGSSEGMAIASTVATGMVYARYAITDNLWALGSYSYTKDIQGKSWSDDATEGGLQMPNQQYDITIGYQLTDRQNITAYYGSDDSSDTDDKWKVSYNYAF